MPFTLFAVLVLLLLGVSYWFGRRQNGVAQQSLMSDRELSLGRGYPRGHEHHRLSWMGALLVLLPIVLGLLVPPQPLGASALLTRDLAPNLQESALPAAVRRSSEKATTEYNLMDWTYVLRAAEAVDTLEGAPADVVGFIYQDPDLAQDTFWLVRFTVSCCVADASPMSLLVHWPAAEDLEDNQWVRVKGRIDTATTDSRGLATLVADRIEAIPAPNQPYLYP